MKNLEYKIIIDNMGSLVGQITASKTVKSGSLPEEPAKTKIVGFEF